MILNNSEPGGANSQSNAERFALLEKNKAINQLKTGDYSLDYDSDFQTYDLKLICSSTDKAVLIEFFKRVFYIVFARLQLKNVLLSSGKIIEGTAAIHITIQNHSDNPEIQKQLLEIGGELMEQPHTNTDLLQYEIYKNDLSIHPQHFYEFYERLLKL